MADLPNWDIYSPEEIEKIVKDGQQLLKKNRNTKRQKAWDFLKMEFEGDDPAALKDFMWEKGYMEKGLQIRGSKLPKVRYHIGDKVYVETAPECKNLTAKEKLKSIVETPEKSWNINDEKGYEEAIKKKKKALMKEMDKEGNQKDQG